mgnify:CR=1 FL=1
MIGEILNLESLITAELNEKFIHCDAKKFNDIVITATIMKKDNLYLITKSKTLSQPIACNVDRDFKKSKFVFISPHLNHLDQSRFEVFNNINCQIASIYKS